LYIFSVPTLSTSPADKVTVYNLTSSQTAYKVILTPLLYVSPLKYPGVVAVLEVAQPINL